MNPTYSAENERILTNIESKINIPEVLLYPNPVTGMLNIRIDDDLNHEIMMFNITGQLLLTWNIWNSTSIDVSHLSPGVYFLNFDRLITKKIVKR